MKRAKKIKTKLLLIFITALLISCDEEPEIERSKLVKIYVETTVAQSKYSAYPDSLELAKDKIYSNYNVTEAEYDSVILNMKAKVDYWDEFFKEAKEYLDTLKNASNQPATL